MSQLYSLHPQHGRGCKNRIRDDAETGREVLWELTNQSRKGAFKRQKLRNPNIFNILYFMFNTLTSVQVTPDRKEGQVESDVSHSGVRLKDGDHS